MISEIKTEIKTVLTGKTFDAILPSVLYAFLFPLTNLRWSITGAVCLAFLFFILRLRKRQNSKYALGGLFAVLIAAGFALISNNAANYYLPTIISSSFIWLVTGLSLIFKKPIAAWLSHLTRAWPLDWFWRNDIRPAYMEVTIVWFFLFTARFLVQISLYQKSELSSMAWINIIMGWPLTLLILVLSYVFGIWRLRQLGGPGVDEYESGKRPPYIGQKKGF